MKNNLQVKKIQNNVYEGIWYTTINSIMIKWEYRDVLYGKRCVEKYA